MKRAAATVTLITIVVGATLCGCAHLSREEAVPPRLTQRALTPEESDDRYWPELDESRAPTIAACAAERERETLIEAGKSPHQLPSANYLAISSGGDDGAFAAGLLVGWTARGDRPVFKVVTGISAGALIAPFAFLGSRYDDVVRRVATSVSRADIFHTRNTLAGLASDGMADSKPLARLVAKYVTPELLAEIARESA